MVPVNRHRIWQLLGDAALAAVERGDDRLDALGVARRAHSARSRISAARAQSASVGTSAKRT